jgi:prevent-host-death family protein
MSGHYDVLITKDRLIAFQQQISTLPFGVVVFRARSNRMQHRSPLVTAILAAIAAAKPDPGSRRLARVLRCFRLDRRNLGDCPQIGGRPMAGMIRKSLARQVPLSELKDDFSRFLREAEKHEIVITRRGKPAGVLIGFQSEDDWFDYCLENDPRFLQRIDRARKNLRAGRGVNIEDVKETP